MSRNLRTWSLYILLAMIAVSLFQMFAARGPQPVKVDYKTFYAQVASGQVKTVKQIGVNVTGQYTDGKEFQTTINPMDPDLPALLRSTPQIQTYEYQVATEPWWPTILSYVVMFAMFGVLWFFFMQQSQMGGNRVLSFGRSRAKMQNDSKKRITFSDVAGYEEVKEELTEVVEFLKNPRKFTEIGARIPKGVLLFGPPGTGKTWMARAVAGEAGVPFFSISGSDFVEMFVGVGASRVRDLFETAKQHAPCIIFIDEIDAVGRQRGAGLGGGHDEREQTLNQLLVELDGFEANEGVIVMAATNRPDVLDPALLRPGRFDRQITVGQPDVREREAILRVHARNKPLAKDVDIAVLAKRTPGFTAADLENLLNEAALLAARHDQHEISMPELEEAINRVIAGPEKKTKIISEREKRIVAFHESGHALTRMLLPNCDPVHLVTIIPRGMAGGMVIWLPEEDRTIMTKSEFLDNVTSMLAGRVAEQLVFGEMSTGAQDDLEKATGTVRRMIMEYGMSEHLGPVTFGNKEEQVFLGRDIARNRNYSEEIAYAIDKETRSIMDDCYHKAEDLLKNSMQKLNKLAELLLERETIRGEELYKLMNDEPPANPPSAPKLNFRPQEG